MGPVIDPATIDLTDLLERWLDPGPRVPVPAGAPLPPQLRAWFEATSRWPEVRTAGLRIHEPEEARAAFMTDPTGDTVWSFDPSDPETVHAGGRRVAEGLTELLVHVTLKAVILLAPGRRMAARVPDTDLPALLAPMELIAFKGLDWPRPGRRMFAGDGLLAETGPAFRQAGHSTVAIGATSEAALSYVDTIPGVHWV
jgi:hypothetical protein